MYIHHENGVLFSNSPVVDEIKQNITMIMKQCEEISLEKWLKRPIRQRFVQWLLKIFSPLF
jgi:cardiolipin synthase